MLCASVVIETVRRRRNTNPLAAKFGASAVIMPIMVTCATFAKGDTGVTDPRKTLLQQIAALRRTIDPSLLERARLASEGKEPYDKEAARAAVCGFLALKSKTDGGAFQRKLLEALKREAEGEPPLESPSAPIPTSAKPSSKPTAPAPKRWIRRS